ncbi:S-adenosyl-L-methionine-dependent methyltransferase [Tuber brumale]|nr:S-adenosyl-L-methionine-dependent methyltransferase [Tuber brumale]
MEDTIEVDWDYEGDDFGYASDTTSLKSSVLSYVYENGRRYHGWRQGRYAMPNDEDEQNRMDLQHHICLLALGGKLHAAPMEDPRRILDLGTGTGIWAIDAADAYPQARVIGTDLSPIQPSLVPPNLHFEVDDIEETWEFADNTFSYIHIRQLAGFIKDWARLYEQALRCLKPGGYFEIQDFADPFCCDDGSLPEDNILRKWPEYWIQAARVAGYTVPGRGHVKAMGASGFEAVDSKRVKIPCGPWPKDKAAKELGIYFLQHGIEGGESLSMGMFTRYLGWTKEQVDGFLDEALRELKNPKYHTYGSYYCVWGRKPAVPLRRNDNVGEDEDPNGDEDPSDDENEGSSDHEDEDPSDGEDDEDGDGNGDDGDDEQDAKASKSHDL